MSPNVQPIPPGFHALTPSLTLKHAREAIAFYQKAFGAQVMDVFPTPDGKSTMHALIRIGDSFLMMADEMPNQGGCQSAESLGASPVSLYLYVPDADRVFQQALAAGASATMPVADMFWGDRCGMLKDPFGYAWTIATHVRELTPAQVQEGAQAFFAKAATP